ncbi:DUF7146 domain-containing protein [Celeribacter ethanolicus]|uniref:DUF7146 domain-containing protein n=1 Tax=Celeribacter ethanolicus TaxID=1758178 RepID=UPI000834CC95|nr:toprim domain-containing protein [Celeribacter ethanolicus]
MSRAENLTRQLGGRWHGHYGMALCPSHEDRRPSLSIALGNDGRILLKCHAGCSYADIRAALEVGGMDRSTLQGNPAIDPERDAARRAKAEAEHRKRSEQARRLWEVAQPIYRSVAETYLRRRGISCALPDTLRYVENCWHPSAKRLPALMSYVSGGTGFAVHRTYLRTDGSGKAPVTPAKAMLGRTKGGAARLIRGYGRLVVAEGIETALSLASGLIKDRPSIWAALSASGMISLRLPQQPGLLTIAGDGDPAGRAAAEQLARRASDMGWQVSLMTAPEGKDWNDVLREREGAL